MKEEEIQSIEKLMRSQFKGAEQTPPAEVWDTLNSRLASAKQSVPATPASKPTGSRRVAWIAAVGMAVIAALAAEAALRWHSSAMDEDSGTKAVAGTTITETCPAADDSNVADISAAVVSGVQQSTVIERKNAIADESRPIVNDGKGVAVSSCDPAMPITSDIAGYVHEDLTVNSHDSGKPTMSKADTVRNTAFDNSSAQTTVEDDKNEDAPKSMMAIRIPNLITPNNDGYNDCWVISDIDGLDNVEVQIYTAQSQRVYSTDNYRNDFCGDDLPEGNYFYVMVIRHMNYSRRGVLVIKRH